MNYKSNTGMDHDCLLSDDEFDEKELDGEENLDIEMNLDIERDFDSASLDHHDSHSHDEEDDDEYDDSALHYLQSSICKDSMSESRYLKKVNFRHTCILN